MSAPPGTPSGPPGQTGAARAGITLGRSFGIEIRLAPSWILALTFLTWALSGHYQMVNAGWSSAARLALALGTATLLFASILAHELGHGLVANALHTPVRRITLHVLGAAAHLEREPERARDELRIAAAGPLTSLALSGLLFLTARLAGVAHLPLARAPAAWLAWANLALALFNLLPALPLDGGRVLRAIVWAAKGNPAAATRATGHAGRVLALALVGTGGWLLMIGAWPSGLSITLIGWYLHATALQAVRHGAIQARLGGRTAADAALTDCPHAHPQDSLELFMHDTLLPSNLPCFPILKPPNDTLVGIITPQQAQAVPRQRWPFTRLEQIMLPAATLPAARPDEPLLDAAERMQRAKTTLMPVIDDGRLIGIITAERLQLLLASPREATDLIKDAAGGP